MLIPVSNMLNSGTFKYQILITFSKVTLRADQWKPVSAAYLLPSPAGSLSQLQNF